jgi:hypothetical protein
VVRAIRTIAKPNLDAKQLAYFSLESASKNALPLSRAAADDIAAYIATLK